ncbi:pantetheine-phosphate adenylyltransferase [Lactococcus nasutitermitis]|uniref:Phosphopantetheine adenylyltransferase n=1 Tax=Lactococcus nasutitermitis TaxID=1652957 RepID=A0ABV9JG09_9LACT|nr:pantetheine-phosphate adenylyltransferase [Lactococcus nasutitermitis]
MTEKIALFTGTFDPLTNGHLDIIIRAAALFDRLYVGIFKNDQKNPLFSTAERVKMLNDTLENLTELSNVRVITHERELTVNIAKKLGVTTLVRSIRNSTDLEYEKNMFYFNHEMTGIETVILLAKPELEPLNSTRMRELTSLGQDVSQWVPKNIAEAIKNRKKV